MKNLLNIINDANQFNLNNIISNRYYSNIEGWKDLIISNDDKKILIELIVSLLGGREKTKTEIRYNLINGYCKPLGIYERIIFESKNNKIVCRYIAGQDYTGEINYIRTQLKK